MHRLAPIAFADVAGREEIVLPRSITEMQDTDLMDKMYLIQQWACFGEENKLTANAQLRRVHRDLETEEAKAYARASGSIEARKRAVNADPEVLSAQDVWLEAKQVCDLVESYISRYDRMYTLLSREVTRRSNKRPQF